MALSKVRKAELEAELLQVMDKLDALKVELREAMADHREQVKLHQAKLKSLRDILSGREGEQAVIPGTESGTVKPAAPRPATKSSFQRSEEAIEKLKQLPPTRCKHGCGSPPHAGICASGPNRHASWKPKPKGELTRWTCDRQAKRVPTFVVECTGLRTKAQILAKYGDGVTFEKGEPTPRGDKKKPAKGKFAELCSRCRREDAETTMDGQRVCFSCAYKRQDEAEAARKSKPKTDALPRQTTAEANQEKCLECHKPAGDPSPGCWECDHGRSKAELEAAP